MYLSLIGLFIFALAEFIFEYAGMGESTNWSIYYFSSTYLSMTLVSAGLLFREGSKSIRISAISFGIFFIVLALIEISFINVPFDKYLQEVNDSKIRWVTYGLLSIILMIISLMAWEKRQRKK